MIKCNVTVCGTVSKAASCRTNKDGKPFVSFAMSVVIPSKSGTDKSVEVSVVRDGVLAEADGCVVGDRIEVEGVLLPRKRGDDVYLNLSANSIKKNTAGDKDCIKGEMEFRGKVRNIDEKTDKNGVPFLRFSAFSTEKVQERFEYLWVSFFLFDGKREAWLQPGARAHIKGSLSLSVFNGKPDFSCRVSEISEYVPQQDRQSEKKETRTTSVGQGKSDGDSLPHNG